MSEAVKRSKCKTVIVEDIVSDNDEFGSHGRIAEAIAELIEGENGGKSIALTGSWGSGKSTTINLLKGKLSSNSKIFIFDAWSHRGDPLRRTFLEKLIFQLEKWDWLSTNINSKNMLEDLSRRRKVSDVNTKPLLTWQGKTLAVLLFLAAIGLPLLDKFGDENVCPIFPEVGTCLVFLPILFFMLFTLFRKPICWGLLFLSGRKIFNFKWLENSCKWCNESDGFFEILINKSTETTRSETIETPDPTSVEFQSSFEKIMKDVFKTQDRKLVIVVDNLDRIDPNDALALWSTMKTFFDFYSAENFEWQKSLWLIVPFDPSALSKLWKPESGETGEKGLSNLAQSFVDKTFNINFAVPPTVLSDWHDYLKKQLKKAFPDHDTDSDDFHNIYRVYRLNCAKDGQFPTPRDIKSFVNSLGAIHRQWQDEIPLYLQALFVIKNRKEWKPVEYFKGQKNDEIKKEIPPDILREDWQELLAAIYFNSPINKAIEIVIGPIVELDLERGNFEDLRTYHNIHGLTKIIESIIGEKIDEWTKSEAKTISMAAYTLSELNFESDNSLNNAWKILCSNAAKVMEWKNLDEPSGRGIVKLVELDGQPEYFNKIIKAISNSKPVETPEQDVPNQKIIEQWLLGIGHILRKLVSSNSSEKFHVEGSAPIYIHTMAVLCEKPELKDVQKYFVPSAPLVTIVKILGSYVASGVFDERFGRIPEVLELMDVSWNWEELISQLQARYTPPNNSPLNQVKVGLTTLHNLALKHERARTALHAMDQGGSILHFLATAKDSSDLDAIAICFFSYLKFYPLLTGFPARQAGNSARGFQIYNQIISNPLTDIELMKRISSLCLEFTTSDELCKTAQSDGRSTNFIIKVFENITRRADGEKYFKTNFIVDKYSFLKEKMDGIIFDELLKISVEKNELGQEVMKSQFNLNKIQIYKSIYMHLKNNEEFKKFIIEGFKNISKESWSSELSQDGVLVEFLILLVKDKNFMNLTISLEDGLLLHANGLVNETVKKGKYFTEWNSVLLALDDSTRKVLFDKLINLLCENKKSCQIVIEYYGQYLINSEIIYENCENLVLKAFENFLNRLNIVELNWTLKICEEANQLLSKVKPGTKKEFTERLFETFKAQEKIENKNILEILKKISKKLGIKLSESE